MSRVRTISILAAAVALGAAVAGSGGASGGGGYFVPGDLLVSRSVYDNNPANVMLGQTLPPGCTSSCGKAVANGSYPEVFNNDGVDGSFGITSKIYLDQLTPSGSLVNSLEVPNSSDPGVGSSSDQMVTSFSSKSELALNLSTDGESLSFMGYLAPIDALDVSNSNTPGVVDPTNPVPSAVYRVVAQLDSNGKFHFTKTNAYSGNNGRAAILNEEGNANVLYTAGNAGNGSNPQPSGVVDGAGAQIITPQVSPESAQNPGTPTPVGSFSVSQLGDSPDKVGKDTNFRGLTISNHVVYLTKGSGGNGVNTVYFIDTTGKACPTGGVGVPQPGATLPAAPISYSDYNMCILKGFPTSLANSKTVTPMYPFGIWFANPTTLYVADEGNGTATYANGTYTAAAAQTTAGLQKWIFNDGQWNLAYTLNSGLNLGQTYIVAGYPTGTNAATGAPWAPATDGLRNITGTVNGDGTATIYGITSTVSGSGDQGADPNRLVSITDGLNTTALPSSESFTTVDAAASGEVLRGVSFTPVCGAANCNQSGSNLGNAALANATLQGVDLQGSNLHGATLTGANLHDAILDGDNLNGADAAGANLVDAELQGANLANSTLTGANLEGADLGGANLAHAKLSGAQLTGANLDGANLEGDDLTNASIAQATTAGANLHGVTWSNTTCPDGTNSSSDGGTCVNNL